MVTCIIYLGSVKRGYNRIHVDYGFEERNAIEQRVIDFAQAYELAVMNTSYR